MKWIDSRPSKTGYYFWRYDNRAGSAVVRLWHLNGSLWVDGGSLGSKMVDDWPGQWAGPIAPPRDDMPEQRSVARLIEDLWAEVDDLWAAIGRGRLGTRM